MSPAGINPGPSLKVLALSDSALGDLVSSSVVISALAGRAQLDLVTRPELNDFHLFLPGVRAVTLEMARGVLYDEVIDLTSSSSTRRWIAELRAGFTRGRADGWWGRFKAGRIYDEVVAKAPSGNIVRDYDPLLRSLGVTAALTPKLSVPPGVELPERLRSLQDFVAIHVGAGNPLRRLPDDLIKSVVRKARAANLPTVFIGTEAEFARDLAKALDGYPIYEPLGLPQLGEVLLRARRLVAPDSGPLHLAAALGARATGIYGPNLIARAAPPADLKLTLIEKDWPCRPCDQNRPCPHGIRCLQSVHADEVQL